MQIRLAKKEDYDTCVKLAKSLSEWFDDNELIEIAKNVAQLPTYVIGSKGVQAFICVAEKSNEVIEIKHIAVSSEQQNTGLGTKLINFIIQQYPNKTIILVKTLDDSAQYIPYKRTRSFYEKNGFIKIDVIDPYPGWSAGNPCAYYIKMLTPPKD